jgi:hypothetical protein
MAIESLRRLRSESRSVGQPSMKVERNLKDAGMSSQVNLEADVQSSRAVAF